MQHFSRLLPELRKKKLFIFLDYDGTLVDIAPTPKEAKMNESRRRLLQNLKKKYKIAILSGRSLREIRKFVGVRGIYYGGNHGLEMAGPGIRFEHAKAKQARSLIRAIWRASRKTLGKVEGAVIENKGLSLGFHYRLVKKEKRSWFKRQVLNLVKPFPQISVQRGKCVIEVRPRVEWNKGSAVLWLLQKSGERKAIALYFGDDLTDEDAFRALRTRGIGVLVARRPRKSHARFYVRSPREVEQVLASLL